MAAAALLAGCKESHKALDLYHEGRSVLRYQQDPVRAEAMLLKALEIDPELTHPRMALAELYFYEVSRKAGLYSEDKAAERLREILQMAPDHIGAHFLAGKIAVRRGDLSLAQEEFAATRRLLDWPFSLADTRAWAELQLYEGFLLLDLGEFQGAKAKFELFKSHNISWWSFVSHTGLMFAAAARGEVSELEELKKKLPLLRKPADPLAFRGVLSIWEGRPEEGADALKKRLEELERKAPRKKGSPSYQKLILKRDLYKKALAWAYLKADRPDEARSLFPASKEVAVPPTLDLVVALFR
jgi:tetratricopeptide (TPR) repeat protein